MMTLALLIRVAVTVGFLSIAVRMTGKRGWIAVRPLDLIMAFVLGNVSGNMALGRMPVSEGITALGLLVWMHLLVSIAIRRSSRFRTWIYGAPKEIIRNGQVQHENLARVNLSDDDLEMVLHREGITRVRDVQLLRLEADDRITLIRQPHMRLLTIAHLAKNAHGPQEDESWPQAA